MTLSANIIYVSISVSLERISSSAWILLKDTAASGLMIFFPIDFILRVVFLLMRGRVKFISQNILYYFAVIQAVPELIALTRSTSADNIPLADWGRTHFDGPYTEIGTMQRRYIYI
jgi:hypothetical protein